MTRILVIQSARPDSESVGRSLTALALEKLGGPGKHEVKTRDLGQAPIPHIDAAAARAHMAMPGEEGPGYKEATKLSDELIGEMKWAELILLCSPMYQGTIPSVLKAWFDRVLRNGHTVMLSPTGAEGLLKGRRVLAILTRGGVHSPEAGGDGLDFQKPYLETIFGIMGMETQCILCEGTGFPPMREGAIAAAKQKIAEHSWLRA